MGQPDRPAPDGPRFTKVYEPGWRRLRQLAEGSTTPTARKLYFWLIDHAGHDNAVVVAVELLARELGVDRRSISRASKELQATNAICVARLGTGQVFILNPDETWRTYEDHKRFCGFSARAILGFKENAGLRARLQHFVGWQQQPARAKPTAPTGSDPTARIDDERQPALIGDTP